MPFFSETEDPGVLAVSGFPVIFHVFFLYIKKNMEQAPADAGVGDVLCLQELAELVDGDEVVRRMRFASSSVTSRYSVSDSLVSVNSLYPKREEKSLA